MTQKDGCLFVAGCVYSGYITDGWLMSALGGKRTLGIDPKSDRQRQNNDDQATNGGAQAAGKTGRPS